MIRRALCRAAVVTGLAAAAGCLPTLAAESTAPPGRSARLDADTGFWGITNYRLELSQGVAIAISCRAEGPCEKLVATSDDPVIAEVRAAALTALRPAVYATNQEPAAAVVVIGKAPGVTTIRLRSKHGGRDVRVTVVPPPAVAAARPQGEGAGLSVLRSPATAFDTHAVNRLPIAIARFIAAPSSLGGEGSPISSALHLVISLDTCQAQAASAHPHISSARSDSWSSTCAARSGRS